VDRLDRGDRVVLIRKLEIRWRLSEESIDAEDAVPRLAADLTAALEPAWAVPIEPPDPDVNLVVFPDAASWWSDALEARAAGRPAWYHRPILDPEPLLALSEPTQAELALSVLRHLGPRAPEVLRCSPRHALLAWARALQVEVPGELGRIASQQVGARGNIDPELVALLRQVHAASGPAPTPALLGLGGLALHLAQAPPSAPLAAEARAFVQALTLAEQRMLAAPEASVETAHPPSPETAPASEPSAGVQIVAVKSDRPGLEGPAPSALEEPVPRLTATSYAGFFYLVTLWLELGTGEHLWQACLPEGRILGWAAAGLVEGDPILTWLGDADLSAPPVTSAQTEEVIAQGCLELAQALPRRRPDVAIPDLELFLVGNELIATLPGSVYPIWSAICPAPSDLREAAAMLSGQWPGALSIPRSFEVLGLGGRFQVRSEEVPRCLFRREGPEPAARLATAVIGTAAALFEWRTDEPCAASGAAFVERWLRIPGRLEDAGEALVVHLRAEDVAFPIRRAGLDRDPGYVPWLQRAVRLCFEGDEPEDDLLPIVRHKDNG